MTTESVPSRRLEPDPKVRKAIVTAATKVIRDEGVRGLSVSNVLVRAGLGTRAFYRHFASKDHLVAAVFLELANAEARRLERLMAGADDPLDAVVAWIDGRLDLAFDDGVQSELRQLSVEAQAQMFASPELVGAAYAAILAPLVAQLERGVQQGRFVDVDPAADALSIQGVLWSSVERHWSTGDQGRAEVRTHVLRFCLRGVGASDEEGAPWT